MINASSQTGDSRHSYLLHAVPASWVMGFARK